MGVQISVRGRVESIPGVYTQINYRPSPVIVALGFGSVALIDTGSNAGYGGLAGINGVSRQGKNAVYRFGSYEEFADYINGGPLLTIANKLFNPGGGRRGASSLVFARACRTYPATKSFALTNGFFDIVTVDEGLYPKTEFRGVKSHVTDIIIRGASENFGVGTGNMIQAGNTLHIEARIPGYSTPYPLIGSRDAVGDIEPLILTGDYDTGSLADRKGVLMNEIIDNLNNANATIRSVEQSNVSPYDITAKLRLSSSLPDFTSSLTLDFDYGQGASPATGLLIGSIKYCVTYTCFPSTPYYKHSG